MDLQLASRLARMPTEIIQRISSSLSTAELGALRRSCKLLEAALFNLFSREFFQKKQFMLTDPSLQALMDISRHDTLSPCLRHLIIGLDHYDHGHRARFATAAQAAAYRGGAAEQFHLLATGRAAEKLAEALRRLGNLETVDIRDFSSARRSREPGATWASYGAPTVLRETGSRLHMQSYPREELASCVFAVVLAALSSAGARPRSIEVLLRNKSWGLTDVAFFIPRDLEPSMAPVLAGLEKLHLDLDLNSGQPTTILAQAAGAYPDASAVLLQKFLAAAPNLTWLRFNFQNSLHVNAESFLRWLGSPAAAAAPAYPSLRRLDVGSVEVTPKALLDIISRFSSSLRALTLWKLILHDTSPADDRVNILANLCRRLASAPHVKIQDLRMGHISQQKTLGALYSITFREGSSSGMQASYSGPSLSQFLNRLADDTVVMWPAASPDGQSDSGDDESMSTDAVDDD